jgi:hypothetical protein
MAYNVRLMPVKVIDGVWDYIFDSPLWGPMMWSRAACATPPTTART